MYLHTLCAVLSRGQACLKQLDRKRSYFARLYLQIYCQYQIYDVHIFIPFHVCLLKYVQYVPPTDALESELSRMACMFFPGLGGGGTPFRF